jgi:tRNA (cytidine/uridine-2'-O-)-methyltransferase
MRRAVGGALRRRFIGTLVKRAQARAGGYGLSSHKPFPVLAVSLPAGFLAGRMHVALFEPDIPQNTGTILRLAACLGIDAHIIEPAGFPVTDRAFRRAGMDYLDRVALTRHLSWNAFEEWRRSRNGRLVLFTTRATLSYLDHAYAPGDILLFGRESSGVPDAVHAAAEVRLVIPMRPGLRSLNVAVACAMAASEALRQLRSRDTTA